MRIARLAIGLGFALCLAPLAAAQSMNVGTGGSALAPSAAYGAASGQSGVWNAVQRLNGQPAQPLVDLAGDATGATAVVCDVCCDASADENGDMTGDDALLLGSFLNADCFGSNTVHLDGLQPGTYQAWVYGYNGVTPTSTQTFLVTVSGGGMGTTYVSGWRHTGGVAFPGHWVDFPVIKVIFEVPAGLSLTIQFSSNGVYGGLAGLQLVKLDAGNVAFCSGHLGDCPCGVGDVGRGCPSSFDAAGAALAALGTPSVSVDDVLLRLEGTSNTWVSFFQSSGFEADGVGSLFGDGLLCIQPPVQRLGIALGAGNVAEFPPARTPSLSQRGGVPAAGGLRTYQAWYRNQAPGYCTPARFNLSNGIALRWSP